jgi:L-fuculose-phosphate aldolase
MATKEHELRQEIVRAGRLMYDKGFISASDGNISARLEPGRILITPSGLHKGLLEADQLLVVDEDGRPQASAGPAGRRLKPTSEMPMHLEAYRRRPDIGAVIHAHPPTTIALSIAGIPLADCLLPEVIVFLGLIPTTEYATPSSQENVRAIHELIANHDAIVLQRHGTLTVGAAPMEAFMRLETVEQNARIAFMLAQLGATNPLAPAEVEKLLEQRRALGLARPGDTAAFCEVCGVCHNGPSHAPTLRPSPGRLAPAVDAAALRQLVAQVIHKTLGNGHE